MSTISNRHIGADVNSYGTKPDMFQRNASATNTGRRFDHKILMYLLISPCLSTVCFDPFVAEPNYFIKNILFIKNALFIQ